MKTSARFAAIVVVYNIACSASSTCACLERLQSEHPLVLIYDNSTSDFGNKSYCEKKGWFYFGGDGNKGLSKAYNSCLDFLTEQNLCDIVCLFDDDTNLSEEYFSALSTALAKKLAKIYVPLISSAGTLISPCRLNRSHRRKLFRSPEEALSYSGKDISAINSGMAIQISVFQEYRYDENIFLDGVDHHFMDQVRQKGFTVSVFNYRCEHSFSGKEMPPFQSALTRFRVYAKDYRYIFQKKPLAYLKLVGKRALALCVLYKRLDFLRYL